MEGDKRWRRRLPRTDRSCTSTFDLVFTVIAWDGEADTLTLNSTEGIDPDPVDWREAPNGLLYFSNGTQTPFGYSFTGVTIHEGRRCRTPAGSNTILITNGSWCWDASPNASNDPWCDDDYKDTDGDGLADWEELTATWGYLSDPLYSIPMETA